jgi:NADH-ubiquinone oxidoreductase chain 3
VYPYVVSAYTNGIYGLVIMLIFFLALTLGFAFELGKNALKIDSRQMFSLYNKKPKWGLSLVKSGVNWYIFT